ncbi:MAG: GDSL-type esterase/lipase family protein [Tissierellia bacterium]|nr:GDSL-type esterase/lipase family protein [Tissierellia bacterium]
MKKILAIGDSLVQGYGVAAHENWVSLLSAYLGPDFKLVNRGLNGDLSSHVVDRLALSLEEEAFYGVLILCGANDLMGSLSVDQVLLSYQACQDLGEAAGTRTLFLLPPKPSFLSEEPFAHMQAYVSLSRKLEDLYGRVPWPHLNLDPLFGGVDSLFIDGIHPSPEGHGLIAQAVFKYGKKETYW